MGARFSVSILKIPSFPVMGNGRNGRMFASSQANAPSIKNPPAFLASSGVIGRIFTRSASANACPAYLPQGFFEAHRMIFPLCPVAQVLISSVFSPLAIMDAQGSRIEIAGIIAIFKNLLLSIFFMMVI